MTDSDKKQTKEFKKTGGRIPAGDKGGIEMEVSAAMVEPNGSELDQLKVINSKLQTQLETLLESDKERTRENVRLRYEIDMLKALTVKQSNDIEALKTGLTDLQVRSMENNVIFHNVKEAAGENCAEKVTALLKTKSFEGEINFDKIHRMGRFDKDNPHPRPIIAKLTTHSHASALVKFGASLSKKRDELRITPQYPASVREKRIQLGEIAEGAKAENSNVRTKIVSDTLFINGDRFRDSLPCPTPKELLYLSDAERAQALSTKFTECHTTEGGCTFVARAAPAKSINDVRALYKAILMNPENTSATHNIAAYRYCSPTVNAGYNDDGDYGMGRAVRDALIRANSTDIAVFVTRYYGGSHLGKKRFDTVERLVTEILSKFSEGQ